MIAENTRAEIKRLFHAEKWKIGTIARNLGIHPGTVQRALNEEVKSEKEPVSRKRSIEPYEAFIKQTLQDHPALTATRLTQMLKERGYKGSVYPIREFARKARPSSRRAYQDLCFFPGEAAQVDWADLGKLEVSPKVFRRVMLFVMVLAWSRRIFAKAFYSQKTGPLLEGHVEAFEFFGGVPRKIAYDNMKTAVVTNTSMGVQFNESLLELAGHYRFQPTACTPYSAWQKGRVERSIRYFRDNFAPQSRSWRDLDELNRQIHGWLQSVSCQRAWPDDSSKTVLEVFAQEKEHLMENPEPLPCYEEKAVRISKKSMARFDCNLYSVPPAHVCKTLVVRATSCLVAFYDCDSLVARHQRCWSKEKKIIDPDHVEAVVKSSRASASRRCRAQIVMRIPSGGLLLKKWNSIDENLSEQSRQVGELIKVYGEETVESAAQLALENQTPRADSIRHIITELKTVDSPPLVARFAREDLKNYMPEKHDLKIYDLF